MRRHLPLAGVLALAACCFLPRVARTDESFAKVAEEVNLKLVKLFGAGGIRGLASYGTGVVISRDGYILTINSHILDTRDLRVHLADGTRYQADVVAREPELDMALCKIKDQKRLALQDYFDIEAAAKLPVMEPGKHVLGFSNLFQIATRDEAMSVQHGVIAAHAKLAARLGVFEATYKGDVYVIDAITNNPGAGGGVITTRKGELLAMIGKELRNELTNTWINYAIPFNAVVEVPTKDGGKLKVGVMDMVKLKEKYRPAPKMEAAKLKTDHGIILVPNVVERTPPYVEEVRENSAASKADLRPDDLIVYVDGYPVQDINGFERILGTYAPGAEVRLEVQRGEKLLSKTLVLGKRAEKKAN